MPATRMAGSISGAWQSVVKVARGTEGGDARGGQGAASKNTLCICI